MMFFELLLVIFLFLGMFVHIKMGTAHIYKNIPKECRIYSGNDLQNFPGKIIKLTHHFKLQYILQTDKSEVAMV